MSVVLAVDGGNSKTDLALARADGSLLSLVRGPLSSPHHIGADGCLHVLESLLDEAVREAGLARASWPVADVAQLLLAGLDFPSEERELLERVVERGWATRVRVGNDTLAVLRAGTERGWGVAVVCGAGINCVGVAPDGREARFPALGAITGDWGGGHDVGAAALSAAARSEDGRGDPTTLEHAVPAHFGLHAPSEVAEAIHRRQLEERRVIELAPIVFAEAARDSVAAGIVARLADEVATMARVALQRLDLTAEPVEVLLGGGLVRAGNGALLAAVEAGLRKVGPSITVRAAASQPIVGSALLALDELQAGSDAQERLRRELGDAAARLEERKLAGAARG